VSITLSPVKLPVQLRLALKGEQMFKSRLMPMAMLFAAILLASCGGAAAEGTVTPTFDPIQIQTIAVETFSAALTQTALVSSTDTPVPTLTASPTLRPLTTITGGPTTSSSGGQVISTTASCYRLTFVSDVTVPDNTAMTQNQAFTKTWKVLNSGSCAWDAGFKFAYQSGEQMGGVTYVLPSAVPANSSIDISVAMTAPARSGTLRGDWQMSTAGGQFFGDIVYVQIVVGGAAATTSTPGTTPASSTSTPVTPSITNTP
jgi:Ig-like domain-containing protein